MQTRKSSRFLGVLLVLTASLGSAAQGPPVTFAPPRSFATGDNPRLMALADINLDGQLDVVSADTNKDVVSVLLNRTPLGADTPDFAPRQAAAVGSVGVGVAVGDLNGDGRLDLAVATRNSQTVSVLFNRTKPGERTVEFAPAQRVDFGTLLPFSVAVRDLNADGRPDLAVTRYGDARGLSVLLNNTAAGSEKAEFAPPQVVDTGGVAVYVVTADFDLDGRPDLAFAAGRLVVVLNRTDPGSPTVRFTPPVGFEVSIGSCVAVADLNGDGKPDVVASSPLADAVSVLRNKTAPGETTPSFVAQPSLPVGHQPRFVAIADLNGDGKLDVATANAPAASAPKDVSVLLNSTEPGADTFRFAPQQQFADGGNAADAVAVGDLNGDGEPDIATAGATGVAVLLNQTPLEAVTRFSAPKRFGTGQRPNSVAASDLNRDGKPDLAVANQSSKSVSVLRSKTEAGAAPDFAQQELLGVGDSPRFLSAGDLNADGNPDLAVANVDSATLSFLRNKTVAGAAELRFADQQTLPVGIGPSSIAQADFNGDGRPDLAVADSSADAVWVLFNRTEPGVASFQFTTPKAFTAGRVPQAVVAADVNLDGRLDLVTANQDSNDVTVLLNNTPAGTKTPSFGEPVPFAAETAPDYVAAGDVNGDGRPDLAVANLTSNSVSVLINGTAPGAKTPTFGKQKSFKAGEAPWGVVLRDLTGNGKPDLVVLSTGLGTALVLFDGTPAGGVIPKFGDPTSFESGLTPLSLSASDLNGDGRADLAIANGASADVSVLLNTPAPKRP